MPLKTNMISSPAHHDPSLCYAFLTHIWELALADGGDKHGMYLYLSVKKCISTSTLAHSSHFTMATVRPMRADDLFKFNTCNLDHLTETYNTGFYLEYLAKWPHLCRVIEGHDGKIEGYSMSPSSHKTLPHDSAQVY